jgi:hypothetical protein
MRSISSRVLNGIPVTPWVLGTVTKMRQAGATESADWNRFWVHTYRELGGRSAESGKKGCPKSGAYALWFLGRLVHGGRAAKNWSVKQIDTQLGKNAAYAILAAEMLAAGSDVSAMRRWPAVQDRYKRETGNSPAATEQGAVKVAVELFRDKALI